jgi:hypothetical protein
MFEIAVEEGKILIPKTKFLERASDDETIETFKVFEKYLIEILNKKDKEIIVDWEKLECILRDADYRQCEAIRQYVFAVLLSLGILKESPRGAYSFSDEEMNPVWGIPGADYSTWRMNRVYFSRKKDARDYGRNKWGGRMDPWFISRLSEVMTRQEICR